MTLLLVPSVSLAIAFRNGFGDLCKEELVGARFAGAEMEATKYRRHLKPNGTHKYDYDY